MKIGRQTVIDYCNRRKNEVCSVQASNANNHIHLKRVKDGLSGTGTTTRYWDCCKATCSWEGNTGSTNVIASCAADGTTVIDDNTQSGCVDGGTAYMCNNQQPLVINETLSYGFAAASFDGAVDLSACCACVVFTFQDDDLANKQMVVQITNTGTDALDGNQFDIQIPGGGVGLNTLGCSTQWGTDVSGWGEQYGGVDTKDDCSALPIDLQPGCQWRFDWMLGDSNPRSNSSRSNVPARLLQSVAVR
ncbi:hypothetical protein NQ317_018576, partial [Molorchus minor]